jgi:hypothetical protein
MTQAKKPALDGSVTAYLRMLSGANKRAPTITDYRVRLPQLARFLSEAGCTISALSDVGCGSNFVTLLE